jgi:hypothetical protein
MQWRLVVPAVALSLLGAAAVAPGAAAADPVVTVAVAPATPQVQDTVTVSGDVTDANGQPVPNAALSATRTDSAGEHPLMAQMTDSAGHYTFEDTPDVYGDVTWTVTWNGTSGQQTVTVTRQPTTVSLAVSDHLVRTGATVTLTAHLGSDTTDRTLSIYAKPYGQDRRLVERGEVDASGDLRASADVDRRTRFIARFDGDEAYAPATQREVVKVIARVGDQLAGYYGTANGYRLYHVGEDPLVTAHLRPELGDVCLYFRAQRRYLGAWHTTALSPCSRTGAGGRTSNELMDGVIDKPYRVRAEWRGSRAAAADNGPWRKLRIRG